MNTNSDYWTCGWVCLSLKEYLFVCLGQLMWLFFICLQSLNTHTHTHRPLPVPSFLLYSDHVRPGPCRWPSKERLITWKESILFAFPLQVFTLLFLCHHLLALSSAFFPLLSVYFTLCLFLFPLTLFSPLSSCIWKHSTVGFTFTNTRLLPLGWILNARGSTKVQISFFWIVLLWNQTHCRFPLPFSGLRGCDECAHGSVEATAGHM